jgi:hypothetical protein
MGSPWAELFLTTITKVYDNIIQTVNRHFRRSSSNKLPFPLHETSFQKTGPAKTT